MIVTATETPKKVAANPAPEIEVYPDAWDRFRGAVHDMTKAGPQHRETSKPIGKRKTNRSKGKIREEKEAR